MNIKNLKYKKGDSHFYLEKVAVTLFVVLLCACQKEANSNQVCIKDKCFNVEIAYTQEELMKGLQFRKELDEKSGMLFVFQSLQDHYFWMKDTLIPLDMIWIDQYRKVSHIEVKVPPCKQDPCASYSGIVPTLYVLEINSGMAQKYKIQIGDKVEIHTLNENSQ